MDAIKIPNSKGRNIAAIIHRPTVKTEKLAILCPGYLDTKDYPHLRRLAEDFARRGYTAIRFDPTGTWESEGDISEYLTSQYLEDIRSALEFMLEEGGYSHVLLGGHSRGGQVSILYAARDARISEVLAIMPSHRPIVGQERDAWEEKGFRESSRDILGSNERMQFKVPFQHVLDRDQFNALMDVKNTYTPIVFLAGELDDLVTPEEVRELYDAANDPKTFVLAKGTIHDYRLKAEEIEHINSQLLEAMQNLTGI